MSLTREIRVTLRAGDVVGTYEIVAPLGVGGMAAVYRVRHQVLQSEHALKVLREDLVAQRSVRARFLEEGKLQANFRHPGLVRVTGVVSEPGVAGLVMDLLEGEDLRTLLEREGAQPVERAVSWVLEALDALHYAHTRGVVHRDVKPSNLFLARTEQGEAVRVLDFGVAKVLGEDHTRTGAALGTYAYMSPEQIEHPAQVDARTDVFSMGVVLYELVTGVEPFGSTTDFETMQRITTGRYRPLQEQRGELPLALGRVVDRALQVDPEARYPSAAAMAEALRPLVEGAPVAAPPQPPAPVLEGRVVRAVHRDDHTLHLAGVLQLLSGVMDLLVMWFAGCLGVGSAAVAAASGVGVPAWGAWMFGCLGLGSLLLLPLGVLEVVSGLQALARGGRGRGLVRATAWAQVCALPVGGLTASLVGVSTLVLLSVRGED